MTAFACTAASLAAFATPRRLSSFISSVSRVFRRKEQFTPSGEISISDSTMQTTYHAFYWTCAGNRLPQTLHQIITNADLKPGRLIIVGDVHGCIDELNQLLAKVSFQSEEDNLVFAGDLVNKGPGSIEVT